MPSTLQFGSKGPEVATLVKLLTKQGCPPRPPVTSGEPKFGRAIENAVLYFQMTHQGADKKWLDIDGVVGRDTWWALKHATGAPQRSFLEVGIPKGITGLRRAVLETAVKQHGVREDAKQPNRGSEVDKFLPPGLTSSPSKKGAPWCCYFVSWVTKKAFGKYPLGERVGSCYVAWSRARKQRRWEPNDGRRVPTPADAFVILHDDPKKGWCTGHIGFVLQVAKNGKSINTVEGNCGNRVKIGRRELGDPTLRGFINFYGDHPQFTRGSLRGPKDLGKSRTR
ncbi:MAG: CHAP domain-containing protein [Acidiferrobacterales bacterium]